MKRSGLILGLVIVSLAFANGGWAGVKHFVANYGSDANPCTQASPCRSFARAVGVTDPGGEVIVLDTGGYGSVTITKSISLIAPVGMYASVTPSSGTNGITIDAGATDQVFIRGLTIKGTTGSLTGILANTVGTLVVDNCFISRLGGAGIRVGAPNSELVILNSKMDNTNYGVLVSNSSGTIWVSMDRVEVINNSVGLVVYPTGTGSVSATVTNSLANHNSTGFSNSGPTSGASVLNLERCVASGNSFGINSFNDSTSGAIRLSNCTVTGNTDHGVYKQPGSLGTIYSRGNNTVVGNGTNSNVAPTAFSAW